MGVDYFRTIGIPLLRGRQIAEEDIVYSDHVAVISELMASRHWPAGEDPIGKRIRIASLPGGRPPSQGDPWVRIVGVAGNVRNSGPREPIRPAAYVPFTLIAPPQRVVALLLCQQKLKPKRLLRRRQKMKQMHRLKVINPGNLSG